jgi:hypothetical protein
MFNEWTCCADKRASAATNGSPLLVDEDSVLIAADNGPIAFRDARQRDLC